jgi:serine protease Do
LGLVILNYLSLIIMSLLLAAAPVLAESPSAPSPSADQIFSDLEKSVFQIRIIELKSGSQLALGTGFLVKGDRIATNYHVISSAALEPEKYRIEIDWQHEKLALTLLQVDVVNDLALLKLPEIVGALPAIFQLSAQKPRKGELLYSLGNPHNLGMTIVEGNYNGLVEKKYLDRIHFSGAINSGMSGGPTVNRKSEVVGINVATAGNQVGFLVPVNALHKLLETVDSATEANAILPTMATQIASATTGMVDQLLSQPWPRQEMGEIRILGEIANWFDCWGNSDLNKDTNLLVISRGCTTADRIFISDHFNSGHFEYEYYYYEAKDWHPTAFYRYIRAETGGARPGNDAEKDDVENFKCVNRIVKTQSTSEGPAEKEKILSKTQRKVSYCVRPYKKLPDLYDAFYIGVTLDKNGRAAMDHFTLSGVTASASQRFLEKFIEVLAWR